MAALLVTASVRIAREVVRLSRRRRDHEAGVRHAEPWGERRAVGHERGVDLVDDHGRAVRFGHRRYRGELLARVQRARRGVGRAEQHDRCLALREPCVDGCGIEAVVRGERDLRDPAPELLVSRENG